MSSTLVLWLILVSVLHDANGRSKENSTRQLLLHREQNDVTLAFQYNQSLTLNHQLSNLIRKRTRRCAPACQPHHCCKRSYCSCVRDYWGPVCYCRKWSERNWLIRVEEEPGDCGWLSVQSRSRIQINFQLISFTLEQKIASLRSARPDSFVTRAAGEMSACCCLSFLSSSACVSLLLLALSLCVSSDVCSFPKLLLGVLNRTFSLLAFLHVPLCLLCFLRSILIITNEQDTLTQTRWQDFIIWLLCLSSSPALLLARLPLLFLSFSKCAKKMITHRWARIDQ